MQSIVYFVDTRSQHKDNSLIAKTAKLFDKLYEDHSFIQPTDFVGIKVHFGETGISTALNPIFARTIVDKIKEKKAKPFLFDTATLYLSGTRANAIDHIGTATKNGFSYATLGAPVVALDGLTGNSFYEVPNKGKHSKTLKLASELKYTNSIVCLSHFTGHCGTGFGATIKSISMGMASRAGKLEMHSATKPYINKHTCTGCGICLQWCPVNAITTKDKTAMINPETCIGCMHCDAHCPTSSIKFHWDCPGDTTLEKMAEYATGVLNEKQGKMIFLNFLLNITPDCDCYPFSDTPFVQDIGITASVDPIAIDQASVDLVNSKPRLKDTALPKNHKDGEDKFLKLWPKSNYQHLLDYAQKLGLGSREYKLVKI